MELANYIQRTKGVFTKARYNQIAKKLRTISKQLKQDVSDNIDVDAVIEYELTKQMKILNKAKKYMAGDVEFLYPSLEQVRTSALFKPVTDTLTYDGFLNSIESGLFEVWDSAVRTGHLTGITTKDIVRNVMGGVAQNAQVANIGTIKALRNSLYANTRTLLQSFASETRNRVYEENDKLFGDTAPDGQVYKYEYLATLDSRTCLVCAESAHLYKELRDIPQLPQHRNCRCTIVPYFNIDNDVKASKDGYVKADITFNDWLEEQDSKTQLEILGRSRYNLYKSGVPVTSFVDNGRVLTLDELNETLD